MLQFFVVACYRVMYHFDDKDLKWMSPYEEGDTILFRSGEDIDTMIVELKKNNDTHCPIVENENFDYSFSAIGELKANVYHNEVSQFLELRIVKYGSDNLHVVCEFAERKGLFVTKRRYVEPNYYVMLTFYRANVNDVLYEDLIILDDRNSEIYNSSNPDTYYVDYFYWSKSKGLVKYKYKDTDSDKGGTYTFYKKLKAAPKRKGWFW